MKYWLCDKTDFIYWKSDDDPEHQALFCDYWETKNVNNWVASSWCNDQLTEENGFFKLNRCKAYALGIDE